MLRINDVVMFEGIRYRILDVSDIRYTWINIDSDKAFPERIQVSEIEEAILSETLKIVEDPFSHLATQLPEQGSVAQQIRDKRMAVIEPLIHQPDIYYRSSRGALVQQVVNESGTAKKHYMLIFANIGSEVACRTRFCRTTINQAGEEKNAQLQEKN